jgi:hypothetical protein
MEIFSFSKQQNPNLPDYMKIGANAPNEMFVLAGFSFLEIWGSGTIRKLCLAPILNLKDRQGKPFQIGRSNRPFQPFKLFR